MPGRCRVGCKLELGGSRAGRILILSSNKRPLAPSVGPALGAGLMDPLAVRERRLLEGPTKDLPRAAVSPPELLRRADGWGYECSSWRRCRCTALFTLYGAEKQASHKGFPGEANEQTEWASRRCWRRESATPGLVRVLGTDPRR